MNHLKKFLLALILPLLLSLQSCELAADIFKVGFWAGIVVVALFVGLIIFIIRKMKK